MKDEEEDYVCTFMHSSFGTLYEKHRGTGKLEEYVVRWHEDERRVRNLFSEVWHLVINQGRMQADMEFPFNSLVMANASGIFNYLCPQHHPSYFIYPDMSS